MGARILWGASAPPMIPIECTRKHTVSEHDKSEVRHQFLRIFVPIQRSSATITYLELGGATSPFPFSRINKSDHVLSKQRSHRFPEMDVARWIAPKDF